MLRIRSTRDGSGRPPTTTTGTEKVHPWVPRCRATSTEICSHSASVTTLPREKASKAGPVQPARSDHKQGDKKMNIVLRVSACLLWVGAAGYASAQQPAAIVYKTNC